MMRRKVDFSAGGDLRIVALAGGVGGAKLVQGLDENSEPGGAGEISEPYRLAALVMPATIEHIRTISEHGERMPAKSTYFYPKLLAGLVIHAHD